MVVQYSVVVGGRPKSLASAGFRMGIVITFCHLQGQYLPQQARCLSAAGRGSTPL